MPVSKREHSHVKMRKATLKEIERIKHEVEKAHKAYGKANYHGSFTHLERAKYKIEAII